MHTLWGHTRHRPGTLTLLRSWTTLSRAIIAVVCGFTTQIGTAPIADDRDTTRAAIAHFHVCDAIGVSHAGSGLGTEPILVALTVRTAVIADPTANTTFVCCVITKGARRAIGVDRTAIGTTVPAKPASPQRSVPPSLLALPSPFLAQMMTHQTNRHSIEQSKRLPLSSIRASHFSGSSTPPSGGH